MKILVCPDKFKGSLDAAEVCAAIEEGLRHAIPGIAVETVPLADGGEGTCDLLTQWNGGTRIELEVSGPLFTPVRAHYGLSQDAETAWIEMAVASGLSLIPHERRNPLLTTTLGTGQLIADALGRNVRHIVIGIGGSATNDAGIGMATALGYRFLDAEGMDLQPTGGNLVHIRSIDTSTINPLLKTARFVTLCDVNNPLFGPDGAAHVYAPQKGADAEMIARLDAGLRNFGNVVRETFEISANFAGAGAAGGLGAGARVFLNSAMRRGIEFVMETTALAEKMTSADLIITGEGRIDHQTFSGKVISEVLRLAHKTGKPIMAVCGKCELSESELASHGLTRVISLVDETTTASAAMQRAADYIREKVIKEFSSAVL